jgi:hypothetical protein
MRPFSTSKKRSDDRGNPYLSPLSALKKGEVAPFMRIVKETKEMQLMTQLRK